MFSILLMKREWKRGRRGQEARTRGRPEVFIKAGSGQGNVGCCCCDMTQQAKVAMRRRQRRSFMSKEKLDKKIRQ